METLRTDAVVFAVASGFGLLWTMCRGGRVVDEVQELALEGEESRGLFLLDFSVTQLNHGSFGVAPREVIAARRRYEEEIEAHPDTWYRERLSDAFDCACDEVEDFVGSPRGCCVLLENATTGVNVALRSLARSGDLRSESSVLFFSSTYNACKNAVREECDRVGALAVEAPMHFPVSGPAQLLEALEDGLEAVRGGGGPVIVLLDAIASPTGVVMPLAEMLERCVALGVAHVVVDGAHAPGTIPIDIASLPDIVSFYTGNLHKWLFVPRGTAFLYINPKLHAHTRGPVISHTPTGPLRSRFSIVGTNDCTRWRCIADAFRFVRNLGGAAALARRNRRLAANAAKALQDAWATPHTPKPRLIAPLDLCGPMVVVETPLSVEKCTKYAAEVLQSTTPAAPDAASKAFGALPEILARRILRDSNVRTVIFHLQDAIWCRISAQLYNTSQDYNALAEAILKLANELGE